MKPTLEDALSMAAPDEGPAAAATARARDRFLHQEVTPQSQPRQGAHPRRTALLTAAAAVSMVLVVPAVAIRVGWVEFRSTDPAPPLIYRQFEDMFGAAAPAGMDPGVLPLSTRKVTVFRLDDGDHALWVALTKSGGFCRVFEGLGGGCTTKKSPLVIPEDGETSPWLIHTTARGVQGERAPDLLGGEVLSTKADHMVLTYEDGTSVDVPLVGVAAPVGAAFFLIDVPSERRQPGVRPLWLAAYDSEGRLIARTHEPMYRINNDVS